MLKKKHRYGRRKVGRRLWFNYVKGVGVPDILSLNRLSDFRSGVNPWPCDAEFPLSIDELWSPDVDENVPEPDVHKIGRLWEKERRLAAKAAKAEKRAMKQRKKRKISWGNTPEGREWSLAVRTRDNWECQGCGDDLSDNPQGLHAHHIKPKSKFPDSRSDVGNGVSLCLGCHRQHHPNLPVAWWE